MIFTIIGTCLNYLNKLKLLIQKQQHSLIPIWYNLQIAISIFFMEPLKNKILNTKSATQEKRIS